jgi:hypothetical protein
VEDSKGASILSPDQHLMSLNTSAHSGGVDLQIDMQKAQIEALRFRSLSTNVPFID